MRRKKIVCASLYAGLVAGSMQAAMIFQGNPLLLESFEADSLELLDGSWSFSPRNVWRIDECQAVHGAKALAVSAGAKNTAASVTVMRQSGVPGEIVFGGWISIKNAKVGRYALVRLTCEAKPSGPPNTTFSVNDEPVYYAASREFRADTQPTWFEHRFSVPVGFREVTLKLALDTPAGEVFFDQLFIAEADGFSTVWNVEKQSVASPEAWRAVGRDYRITARASDAKENDILWADVDFARFFLTHGERGMLDRGSAELWAVAGDRAEKLDVVCDYVQSSLEDHFQHNGMVRWRARNWAERYELYFNPIGPNGEATEPQPVFLGAGELLRYAPDVIVPAWGGWPGSYLEVMDADGDGDWDLYSGNAAEGRFICRNIGSNEKPLFAPRVKRLSSDKSPTSARTGVWLDWDGDGDKDRVRGIRKPLGTYVDGALLNFGFGENTSSGMASDVKLVDESGTDIELADATWFLIDSGDFDNDGRPDLAVGTAMGTLDLLLNRGVSSGKAVVKHVQVPFDLYSTELFESGDMTLKPVVLDWDGDGDDDIVFTAWQSFFWLLLNDGKPGVVSFAPAQQLMQKGGYLALGDSAAPTVVDWDGDGDLDLVCGSVCGHIGYFENIGSRQKPQFAGMVELENDLGDPIYIIAKGEEPIQGPAETMWGYLSCESWDVDRDGDLDLIINDALGRLRWIENTGTRTAPVLSHDIHDFMYKGSPVITPWRNRPGIVDMTGDGLLDVFLMNKFGDLVCFQQSEKDPSVFSKVRNMGSRVSNTIPLNSQKRAGARGRRNIDAGDFNGDGKIDLLVAKSRHAEPAGSIWFLKNIGRNSEPVFDVELLEARNGTFLEWTGSAGHEQWHVGCPEMVDWDGDGKTDILNGIESGRFAFYAADYFDGKSFPAVELLSVEKKTAPGTEKISLQNSQTDVQELGAQTLPLQALP
ncbi:FG-GAP repeat domain-containing protein [Tichowtungia aerotolerans]|uniref:VCBS repeat-containing protein n=1 Tax=Tichowtungia aerotolerans TaxID=2697043 RepID=A0A6P1M7M1_9BACT|nr:VCBS repeat-containing protein [Tichowtungia aerotolerans]QHI69053.1 hypothetical protein GT409_06205 [Tichowtungia aerotolerans]